MCEQPVWGLYGCTDSTKYLTPHFGSFGMHFKKVGDCMQIERVVKNSIAAEIGINSGVYVHVAGVSQYEKVLAKIRDAMSKKRVLKLVVVGHHASASDVPWFRRLFRTKVMPK